MAFLFFIVSFAASVIGAICGVGGGILIKPILDAFGAADAASINFLSGCTVLAMSAFTFLRATMAKDSQVRLRTCTPMAIGAAVGGVGGKLLFDFIKSSMPDPQGIGVVQAACLLVITVGTLIYSLFKSKIKTHQLENLPIIFVIGLLLGLMSSFLGIGGGPINLVVLFYVFSMDTKEAAQNSLFIILFSQAASLLFTVLTGTIPPFIWYHLLLMVAGGIAGGILGRRAHQRMQASSVHGLFIALMGVIILICLYNILWA
jgi:uncharacterized membrane protein YfcA